LDLELPALSVVFVQSRDGNTVAENPSTLGGGVTDTHLIYEGLSRVEADGVMAGAATARGKETVFSIWHPQLVALRRTFGLPRHPAQIVVTDRGDLPIDESLMFQEPSLRVFVISRSLVAEFLHERIRSRPWVEVIDGGEPLSLTSALAQLFHRGMRNISCVGGPRTATSLLREGLVQDLYLTTSPVRGGEPNTPFYQGPPLDLKRVVAKAGQGSEEGVCFEHFIVDSKDVEKWKSGKVEK
jgi:riboflavin biosynthesis pyrimidine reductase